MQTQGIWWNDFPDLKTISDPAWVSAAQSATSFVVPAGRTVFRVGDPCQNFVFVLNGSIRVHKASEGGREILLYRVERGDICILTLFNLLGNAQYAADGLAETHVQGMAITAAHFHRCLGESPGFRRFIFATMGQRLANLMMLLEEVMFQRLDVRLARLLIDRCPDEGEGAVRMKHCELATELGSSREVVSRILKDFEHRGWLQLARGQIRIESRQQLSRFALARPVPL